VGVVLLIGINRRVVVDSMKKSSATLFLGSKDTLETAGAPFVPGLTLRRPWTEREE